MPIVNIISLDKKVDVFDNYALQQVAKYYLLQGFKITSDISKIGIAERTYISIIFTKSRPLAEQYQYLPGVTIGGTGWDIHSRLPAEIEAMRPKINYGFTTRGCNRACSFCFVPEKEGRLNIVADLYDLWNGIDGADIKILDNNILQAPEHFRLICEQAKQHRLRLDFNQGLDWRSFTEDTVADLKGVRLPPRLRIAFDNPSEEVAFLEHLPLIMRVRKQPFVYVLVGFNTTIEEDLRRLDFLWFNGCKPYVMRHNNADGNREYSLLATYANSSGGFFPKISFEEFKQRMEKKTKEIYNV